MGKRLIIASLLLATACSKQPAADADGGVKVVAGALATAPHVRATAALTAAAKRAPETPREQPKLLSVAESAQVHTAEMWSEPVTPGR
jgi:hypothetical protein